MRFQLRTALCAIFIFTSACATPYKNTNNTAKPTEEVTTTQNTPSESTDATREPAKVTRSGDDYKVEWCNSGYARAKYKILVNKKDINAGGTLDTNGCLSTTLRDGRVQPGDRLEYTIEGVTIATETVPGSSSGGGNTPRPQPQPQPSPQPPAKPNYDLGKARNSGENHARCTANAVVNLYGQVEAYRYSFSRGFRTGLAIFDFSNLGQVRNSSEYQNGSRDGERDGARSGEVAGGTRGADEGRAKAASDVMARYYSIIDQNQPPDLSKPAAGPGFEGLPSDLGEAGGLEDRISTVEQEYRSEMMRLAFDYDGDRYAWNAWDDRWSLTNYYRRGYQNELIDSYYREEWAFELFRKGNFSRCRDGVDYYDKITDSSAYANAAEAGRAYRKSFKDEYDDVIDKKWRDAVRKGNSSAELRGVYYGNKVARDHAYHLGYRTSYRINYTRSSARAYDAMYVGTYSNSFDSEVKKYESNVVPRLEEAFVIDQNGSQGIITVGESVGAELARLVNLGRQQGEVSVAIEGSAIDQAQVKKVRLSPSSSLKEERKVLGLGIVSPAVEPNKRVDVQIRVGQSFKTSSFVNDWGTLVRNAARSQGASAQTQLAYISTYMMKEVKDNYGGGFLGLGNNFWAAERETLIKAAADVVSALPAEQKKQFANVVASVRTQLGKKPGFFSSGTKVAEWEAVTAYLNRMQ